MLDLSRPAVPAAAPRAPGHPGPPAPDQEAGGSFFGGFPYPHPNAKKGVDTWRDRYAMHDDAGARVEDTWQEMARRVASTVARPHRSAAYEEPFYAAIAAARFVPGGRVLGGAGIGFGRATLSNCYVVPIGDSRGSIFGQALPESMEILSKGGGVGINFTPLRPRGAFLSASRGHASGPCSFVSVFNGAGHTIEQGGSRRAAMMGQLDVDHPDILEFVHWKATHPPAPGCYSAETWEHFNVSVQITDSFLDRLGRGEAAAGALWEAVCLQAWQSGDPGLYFIDRANATSNAGFYQEMICTNPCGEVELPAYGTCNLGSVNLKAHLRRQADGGMTLDFEALAETVALGVRFLDNVLTVNYWPLPATRRENRRSRRIGLGTMGLADTLVECGLAYGSEAAVRWCDEVYAWIAKAAYRESARLAKERGPFGAYDPAWLERPFVKRVCEDAGLEAELRASGARNVTLLAQAPTGTISTVAGVSSGIEPIFARGWVRTDRIDSGGTTISTPYALSPHLRTANELSPWEHIRMQAAVQRWTDQGSSKTTNLKRSATVDDVREVYRHALESGIKGTTVFRDGCLGDLAVLRPLSAADAVALRAQQEQAAPAPLVIPEGAVCRAGVCEF